mmetsp:Transcript_38505/g.96642  ORF Transcript_38505/g.96642 Transcript_38505/m.96642 type:complete len:261 (-) Transcript_38505:2-784(-)
MIQCSGSVAGVPARGPVGCDGERRIRHAQFSAKLRLAHTSHPAHVRTQALCCRHLRRRLVVGPLRKPNGELELHIGLDPLHPAQRLQQRRVQVPVKRLCYRRELGVIVVVRNHLAGEVNELVAHAHAPRREVRHDRANTGRRDDGVDLQVGKRAHVRLVIDLVRRRNATIGMSVPLHEDQGVRATRPLQLHDLDIHTAVICLHNLAGARHDVESDAPELIFRVETHQGGAADDAEAHVQTRVEPRIRTRRLKGFGPNGLK